MRYRFPESQVIRKTPDAVVRLQTWEICISRTTCCVHCFGLGCFTYETVFPLAKDVPKGHHCYLRPEGAQKSLWEGEWREPLLNRQAGNTDEILVILLCNSTCLMLFFMSLLQLLKLFVGDSVIHTQSHSEKA